LVVKTFSVEDAPDATDAGVRLADALDGRPLTVSAMFPTLALTVVVLTV
jgi:hypothetical protein